MISVRLWSRFKHVARATFKLGPMSQTPNIRDFFSPPPSKSAPPPKKKKRGAGRPSDAAKAAENAAAQAEEAQYMSELYKLGTEHERGWAVAGRQTNNI